MTNDNSLLHKLTTEYGHIYGSDLLAKQLYLIIKREKPINVIELGTGLGISTFGMRKALQEDGEGKVLLQKVPNVTQGAKLEVIYLHDLY